MLLAALFYLMLPDHSSLQCSSRRPVEYLKLNADSEFCIHHVYSCYNIIIEINVIALS